MIARNWSLGVVGWWGAAVLALSGTVTTAAGPISFNKDIRPILADRCFACHGPDSAARKADLRLDLEDAAKALLKDGDGARAIAPGNAKASEVMHRLLTKDRGDVMPPPKSKLTITKAEIDLIGRWIDQGAKWQKHWAFLPPKKRPAPNLATKGRVGNLIDRFVLQRVQDEMRTQSREADRATLLRRLSFDLTGLPPSLAELDAFAADKSSEVYEKAVDRLLESSAFGERMAVEWLDVARYGDTDGLFEDHARNIFPWRDWVVRAFNSNLAYSDFITWQVAGDLLPDATVEQKIATGFLRNNTTSNEGGIIDEDYRIKYLVDRVNTTATAFLGLTMECAQCHDHKYDPMTQKEYYQFGGFFNSLVGRGNTKGATAPTLKVNSPEAIARLAEIKPLIARYDAIVNADSTELQVAFSDWRKSLQAIAWSDASISEATTTGNSKLTLTGNAINRVGNKAEVKVRTVRVVDTEGPVIKLKGEATVQIEAGGSYEEPGASASDRVEGDLTAAVKISGEVDASMTGSYVIRYEAKDSRGNAGSPAARRVVVMDTTPPTVKRIEPLQVLEGKPLQITVSANDNGRADSVLTYSLRGAPDGVSLAEATQSIEWTPAEEQGPGVYRFDVVVSDGKLETVREILIEVEEVNAPPVALEAALVATEDGQVKIQLDGTDIEGAALTYRVIDPPQNGQLAGSGRDLSYVPAKDFNGQDGFTFAVSDGELESASAKVSITVEPAEDAPQITVVNNLIGAHEDEAYTVSHGALLEASDAFDADGDPLTFLIGEVSGGTLLDADGEPLAKAALAPGESVQWLPPADAYGALEAFPVQVADALGQAERTVAVTIEVEGVPDDPVLKWAKPEGIVYGTALGQVQLSAAADVPGVFEYKPELGTVFKAGNGQSLKAKFMPRDTTEYNIVEARVTIDVALAKPEVSWFNPGDIDAGTALSGVQLNATADVPGQFEYDPAAGTVFEVREGEIFSVFTLKVQFVPTDESNYLPADREVEITVLPRTPENDAPSILVEPEGFDVVAGGEGQLSVSAVGLKPMVFQWYRNGETITGATDPVLKLESISVEEAGNYEVEVANNLGKTRSKVALLNVLEPPVLEGGLNPATVNLGDPHKFILILLSQALSLTHPSRPTGTKAEQ